jgi:hypothetical protein
MALSPLEGLSDPKQGRASVLACQDFIDLDEKFGLVRTLALPSKGFGGSTIIQHPWRLRALQTGQSGIK